MQPLFPFRFVLLAVLVMAVARVGAVFNPHECPIALAGADNAPGCTLVPGGQACAPGTHVFCQYLAPGQTTTTDFCCSLEPSNLTKAQTRACVRGCEGAFKADKSSAGCKRGQAGYKSCQLVAKARLSDCKGFCHY